MLSDALQRINWIDLLVVILLVRSSYVGFTKGFGWELFRFISYIATGLAAVYLYEVASQFIGDYAPALYPFSALISFTGIYLALLFIFKFINILLEKIIKIEAFSTVERFGGLFLGFLKGCLLISLLLISLVLTPIPYFEKSIKERAYTGLTVLKVVPFLYEKAAVIFPALKFGQRNEALRNITGLREKGIGGPPAGRQDKR